MINSQAKGKRGENEFINRWCELIGITRGPRHRRNCQATAWGGASNADVELPELPSSHIEIKNDKTFKFPAWTKKLKQECPPAKVPVLAYREQGRAEFFWLLLPMDNLEKFACEVVEAFGWRLEKP